MHSLLPATLLALLVLTSADAAAAATPPVNVTLYAEALCPYCAGFVANEAADLLGCWGDDVRLRVVPWGNAVRTTVWEGGRGGGWGLHGTLPLKDGHPCL